MAGHEREQRPIPDHPYRDTAIVYGVMAVLLVVVTGIVGGGVPRAIVVGSAFWVLATAWGSWKFRGRIRARDAARAGGGVGGVGGAGPVSEFDPEASDAGDAVALGGDENATVGGNGNGREGVAP